MGSTEADALQMHHGSEVSDIEWATEATSDHEGRATLLLPYATGSNGLVGAGPYNISDGVHHGLLTLDEKDVAGGRMEIDLGS